MKKKTKHTKDHQPISKSNTPQATKQQNVQSLIKSFNSKRTKLENNKTLQTPTKNDLDTFYKNSEELSDLSTFNQINAVNNYNNNNSNEKLSKESTLSSTNITKS